MTEVLEDVLADLMGVEIDPHRQGKRDEGGFFGTPHNLKQGDTHRCPVITDITTPTRCEGGP